MAGEQTTGKPIALCLSGGGLRATFFHLGVIQALREKDRLGNVTEIYSVSGGSIIAAHLLANWAKYNGTSDEFSQAEKDLKTIAVRDIRGRVVRRWLIALLTIVPRLFGVTRTSLLAREYRGIFGPLTMREAAGSTSTPNLNILSTSFNTGALCSFTSDYLAIHDATRVNNVPGDLIPLSFAVAASSAFPPLFPPVQLTARMVGDRNRQFLTSDIALTDGGVFDNLGFKKLSMMAGANNDKSDTLVILSDGSGAFENHPNRTYSSIVARTARATDILMRRMAEETILAAKTHKNLCHVSIGSDQHRSSYPKGVLAQIQNIRTDLDRFSRDEVELLTTHGREVAYCEMGKIYGDLVVQPPHNPARAASLAAIVEKAACRSWGLFNPSDLASYVLWTLLIAPVVICGWLAWGALSDNDARIAQLTAIADTSAAPPANTQVQTPQPNPPTVEARDFTVWIQFAGVLKREQIIALATNLAQSWSLPARNGERIGSAAGLNEVRYGPPESKAAAERLASEINAFTSDGQPLLSRQVGIRAVPAIKGKSLEVWISK